MNRFYILYFFILIHSQVSCVNAQKQHEIDYIITNDYMSERNISMMGGPVTSSYKKGLTDSLQNCFVENFDKELLISKKYFNKIGAQYQTNLYYYAAKDRLQKVLEIDEYFMTLVHTYTNTKTVLI